MSNRRVGGASTRALRAVQILACVLVVLMGFCLTARPARAANGTSVGLEVTQHFTQPGGVNASNVFDYRLTGLDAGGDPLPGGASGATFSFSLAGETVKTLDPITFSHAGVYRYDLKEVVGDPKPGFTYDTTDYTVTIQVLNQPDGSLNAVTVLDAGNGVKPAAIVFSNIYALNGTTPDMMTDPPVNKSVQGNPSKQEKWEFDLTAQDPKNPMPDGSNNGTKAIYIDGTGTQDFGKWTYSAAGVYIYKIAERNTNVAGYVYDSSVYTITDYVTAGSGALELNRVVTNGANKNVTSCGFVNTFSAPVVAKPPSNGGGIGGDLGNSILGANVHTGGFSQTTLQSFAIAGLIGAAACFFLFFMVGRRRKKETENDNLLVESNTAA